jgi:hypothetical protein
MSRHAAPPERRNRRDGWIPFIGGAKVESRCHEHCSSVGKARDPERRESRVAESFLRSIENNRSIASDTAQRPYRWTIKGVKTGAYPASASLHDCQG